MNKREIEKKLRKAVKHCTPDMKKQVVAMCMNNAGNGDSIVFVKNGVKKYKRIALFGNLVAAVAVLALALNIIFSVANTTKMNHVETIVDIDVNPSIELTINASDRVVTAKAINQDAEAILDGMDLEGASTKVAVNAIVGSMFKHGYLKDDTNAILVSVENDDANKSAEIQNVITTDIDELVKAYEADVSVIGQVIVEDSYLSDMALQYGISEGKASLIRKIIENESAYMIDDLVPLTISELNDIICSIEHTGDILDNQNEPDIPSDNTISDVTVSGDNADDNDSTVSENSVSENSIIGDSEHTESVSENSVSQNSVTDDSQIQNTVSENAIQDENETYFNDSTDA